MTSVPFPDDRRRVARGAVLPVASVVLAVVWLGGLASVLAVATGAVTLRTAGARPDWAPRVAWVGIALGLLGIAAAVVFGGLLMGAESSGS